MTAQPPPVFDLTGKAVWITGAGKGLGRAIAMAMASAGARIVVTSRTRADLDRLAAEIDGEVDVFPASVDDSAAVDQVVDDLVARVGRLDAVVHCAGISPLFVPSERITDEQWQQVLRVNLDGTFHVCRAAARVFLEQGSGAIVNVTSVHARVGYERIAPYAASKGAIEALARTLAVEWADRGVRVNTLAPGYFDTDLSSGLLESKHAPRIVGHIPVGRVGAPCEVAGAALFLVSDAASYITGSTITVDGGWTAW